MKSGTRRAQIRHLPVALIVCAMMCVSALGGIAAPAVPAWRADTPWTTETAIVRFARDTVEAEVADTAALRGRGLGYRDTLLPGTGMLFVYEWPAVHTFWMKGMRICLDIVWIEGGEVRGAAESVCPEPGIDDSDLERYPSPAPVTFVLEVPAGWMDEHGYGEGDSVEIELPASG